MLERATACLKSAAARDSIKCAQKIPRSKRMLHSTFWNHGAGALDLPPWAHSMFPMPSDLPLKHDSMTAYQSKSRKSKRTDSACSVNAAPDGLFLDFLYPPQALAWLQRTCAQQQLQRWQKRNVKRLPEGFVVASRGYASSSYRPFEAAVEETEEQMEEPVAMEPADSQSNQHTAKSQLYGNTLKEAPNDSQVKQDNRQQTQNTAESASTSGERIAQDEVGSGSHFAFADSPGDLAEPTLDRTQTLRNMMLSVRSKSILSDPKKSQEQTEKTWKLFDSLAEGRKADMRLKQELLDYLALHRNPLAESRCVELYESIPKNGRTLPVYAAILSIFLRQGQYTFASKLHKEALQSLANAHLISKTLFEYAVEHQRWHFAIRIATQHRRAYTELNRAGQIRVFWLHVSEMPQLLGKAVQLATYLRGIRGLHGADADTCLFCARFFKEAVSQQFLRPSEDTQSTTTWKGFRHSRPPQEALRLVFGYIAAMDKDAARLFEDTLMAILRSESKVKYADYHGVVSYIYREYRKLPGARPPRQLLSAFLWRLTRYEMRLKTNWDVNVSVGIATIVNDWKLFHRHLSKDVVSLLLTFYAKSGDLSKFDHWLEYLRKEYPDYADQKDTLWTMVYIQARRADLDKAQQAFAEVNRIAAQHGDHPDLKCWNVLLHAHARADDLEGAFTNFQNLLDFAKLKPDTYSFNPLLTMLAKRGDVDGVEDLIQQYDQIVQYKRDAMMMVHLIDAHVNNDDLPGADAALREAVEKWQRGDIFGSITPCFNVILYAHASRRDIDATMRTYHQMKQENVDINADSFGALIQVLSHYRQTDAAYKILTTVMPEHNVEPTSFHYGIVMLGLIGKRMYEQTLELHETMSKRNIRPSTSTNVAYLKARAYLEHQEKRNDTEDELKPVPLETSIDDLQELMQRYDGGEIASKEPRSLVGSPDQGTANPAAYFETLISLHGKRKCFEAVQDLFSQYKETAKERGVDEDNPPIRILSALMSAHWEAGEYDTVEEYWILAKAQADEIAPPVPVPSFKKMIPDSSVNVDPLDLQPPAEYNAAEREEAIPRSNPSLNERPPSEPKQTLLLDKDVPLMRRPAPTRRYLLNEPLRHFLRALNAQTRVVDAITIVSRLLTQGYAMDKRTWNFFIECLLDTSPPLALLAYVLTERFLMPEFPGWTRTTKFRVSRQARYEGLEHIRARYLRRDQLMPQYKTLVRLGAAMLDIRRLEALGRRGLKTTVPPELERFVGTTREIRKRAAKTLFAVQSMPVIADRWQAKYLRREGA